MSNYLEKYLKYKTKYLELKAQHGGIVLNHLIVLKIQTMTNRIFEVHLESSDTIANLKKKIEEKEGIPANIIGLIIAGTRLEDNKTLAHYNIQDGSIMNMGIL
jgi:hypothetical protein